MTQENSATQSEEVVILGAGPAGLTAAWELNQLGHSSVLFEQDNQVGGIARTCVYKGYRFDIGGHRFFTKAPYVQTLWDDMLDEEFLERPRLSRIYYNSRFFDYPLKPMNALLGLGLFESFRIGSSYIKSRAFPVRDERNFEDWVVNRFGRRLYEIFFKTYTEKVWGMDCREISADWAAQRIKNLDLIAAVRNALLGERSKNGAVITTLIERFHYPRFGPGQMWETATTKLADKGVATHLEHRVKQIRLDAGRVRSVQVEGPDGDFEVEGEHFISSLPVRTLLTIMEPPPPQPVLDAANRLRYRDFLTVVLVVKKRELFPDNWIYIHEPKVKLGRVQNFKNWSPEMVPDESMTSLGLEYFVHEGDDVWAASDADLIALGTRECALLGLIDADDVVDGTVVRMPKAYPVYDSEYRDALTEIRQWLQLQAPNLQLIGRNGQHCYNNQDHSMLTAVYAARNIDAGKEIHDVWSVNAEDEYHEEQRATDAVSVSGERQVPQRLAGPTVGELVGDAFARYDAVALGAALATLCAVGLFLATAILLLKGGAAIGPNLSLAGHFLLGFEPSWTGALIGTLEAGALGFVVGWLIAKIINRVIDSEQKRFVRQMQAQVEFF